MGADQPERRGVMRILLLLALGLPLAGCISVTGPKPVPEWAMNPQGGDAYAEPQPQRRAARQRAPEVASEEQGEPAAPAVGLAAASTGNRMTDAAPNGLRPANPQSAELTRPVVRRKPTALPKEGELSKAAEPDWQAPDAGVSRTINSICRGC